jgi:hypothetical protein
MGARYIIGYVCSSGTDAIISVIRFTGTASPRQSAIGNHELFAENLPNEW